MRQHNDSSIQTSRSFVQGRRFRTPNTNPYPRQRLDLHIPTLSKDESWCTRQKPAVLGTRERLLLNKVEAVNANPQSLVAIVMIVVAQPENKDMR